MRKLTPAAVAVASASAFANAITITITITIAFAIAAVSLAACGPSTAVSMDAGAADAAPPAADLTTEDGPILPPPSEPGRHAVTFGETRRVVPGPGIPDTIQPRNSNNNLDVVRHDGRVYLAWRAAPDHFASADAELHVVSSADEITWKEETAIQLGMDLREPRLLSHGGRLFLYFARLGVNAIAFEPRGASFTERKPDGTWTAPADLYQPGYIPWRARIERGVPYLVAYKGGEHIYDFSGKPLAIDLLTTTDGITWTPATPGMPAISTGGGSETDFAIADDGTLFGVIRNEAGDAEFNWGSKVCRARSGQYGTWTCKADPKKYDSPLMFWHDGEAYLIARRHVSHTGNYDLMHRDKPFIAQLAENQIEYKKRPKKCALWRYVQAEDRIAYIADLPSNGDTCFPAALKLEAPGEFAVYNYSSDVDGPVLAWEAGQLGPTYIYRTVLKFTGR